MRIRALADDQISAGGTYVLPCFESPPGVPLVLPLAPSRLQTRLARFLQDEGFRGKERELALLPLDEPGLPARILVLGLGAEPRAGLLAVRSYAAQAVRLATAARRPRLQVGVPTLPGLLPETILQHLALGAVLGQYRFDAYRAERPDFTLQEVQLLLPAASGVSAGRRSLTAAVRRGEVLGQAVGLARDLVNEPPAALTPALFAARASRLAADTSLECTVLEASRLARDGFGGLVGVGRGSVAEPCLVHLTYRPRRRPRGRLALVGKGVTFDAGGLNLKTGKGLETMKADMAGAAAVLAVLQAAAHLEVPYQLEGILPLAENLPSGSALRPGDIVRALDGTTIEIVNTDAEGRLILADAIAYAVRLPVDGIVELATLTGACVVALGPGTAAVLGEDEPLVARVLDAGRRAGESLWRLPLLPELQREVEGEVADLKNAGSREGGAIQGGLFLRRFARQVPFVHVDIAGPALAAKESPLGPKGGTGFGVLTLAELLSPTATPRP